MAFLLLLLYLVVLYIRPAEWIPAFAGWQLADLTLISAGIFLVFRIVATRKGLVQVPHHGFILGLLGAIVASHAVHTYVWGLKASLVRFAPVVILYFLVANTLTSERRFKTVLWVLLTLTAVLAWQGIAQKAAGYGWAGQKLIAGRITWIGTLNDPNDLALAFIIMVPVLLAILIKPGFFGVKVLPFGLLWLLVYGIYLTNSRGGALGFVAAVLFFFVKRSRYVVPGGILGGLFALPFFLFGPSRLGLLSSSPDESVYGRLDSWYYGFQLMKSNPIFGVGQNMFTNDYPLTAHNSFVLAASELGLVGLFCWVGLFYVSFKGLSRVQRHHARLAPYAYGLQAALVGFGATAFFLSRTYNDLPYLVCALSVALYHLAGQDTDQVAFRFTGRDARNVALLSLGSLVLAQIAMKTWL